MLAPEPEILRAPTEVLLVTGPPAAGRSALLGSLLAGLPPQPSLLLRRVLVLSGILRGVVKSGGARGAARGAALGLGRRCRCSGARR